MRVPEAAASSVEMKWDGEGWAPLRIAALGGACQTLPLTNRELAVECAAAEFAVLEPAAPPEAPFDP